MIIIFLPLIWNSFLMVNILQSFGSLICRVICDLDISDYCFPPGKIRCALARIQVKPFLFVSCVQARLGDCGAFSPLLVLAVRWCCPGISCWGSLLHSVKSSIGGHPQSHEHPTPASLTLRNLVETSCLSQATVLSFLLFCVCYLAPLGGTDLLVPLIFLLNMFNFNGKD